MTTVVALRSFDHYGHRRQVSQFEVSEGHAKRMVQAGLVAKKGTQSDPKWTTDEKSSALPVVQVSTQKTSQKSKRRARKKKATQSSSPSQPLVSHPGQPCCIRWIWHCVGSITRK